MEGKIFLTGISGFIGSNLGKRLAIDNRVYALVRRPIEQIDASIMPIIGDILKPDTFISIIKECDVVYHCAAYISFRKKDFEKAFQINVRGTRNILEAAYRGGVRKVVHLSACGVLGFSSDRNIVLDETANPEIQQNNTYTYTKKLAEEEVQKYVQKGLNVSIANIATVYGQGDRKLNSGAIIRAIYENKIKFAPPGGTSYVNIDDLVDGLLLLAEKGKAGERYIFCNENLTFLELFNRIAKVLGRKEIKFKIPRWTYIPIIASTYILDKIIGQNGDKINLVTPQIIKESYNFKYYSSKKANDKLDWKPQKSLEEAVIKAIDFYKSKGIISK